MVTLLLSATVRDLVKKFHDPSSLRIAVLWQKGPDEEFDPESGRGVELEVVEISHADSQGCNWARREIQKRWRGEPFTLILDSHHRFAPGWDQKLRRAYDALIRQGDEKPIVTASAGLQALDRPIRPAKAPAVERREACAPAVSNFNALLGPHPDAPG